MVLDKNQCSKVIKYAKSFGIKHITSFADDLSTESTDYNYGGVVNSAETEWLFKIIEDFVKPLFPNVDRNKIRTVNVHEFFTGAKFVRHIDVVREPEYYYIVGATLSDSFSGGKLMAFEPDEELAPTMGKFYGMYSSRPHEVTKVESGTRWSMVCFLTRDQLGIKKNLM